LITSSKLLKNAPKAVPDVFIGIAIMSMASYDRYTLFPITPDDYLTLANIFILAFMRNPLHYMTYPPDVSHEEIVQYTLETKIKFVEEGKEVLMIKVVDNQTPDRQIVGFATWLMGPKPRNREPQRPGGANFKFLEDFMRKLNPISKRVYDEEKDIGRQSGPDGNGVDANQL
jgi:hypothetical protein